MNPQPQTAPTIDQQDRELAQMILSYLADRPHAMDTTEGIARWWLLRQRVQMVLAQVERVLDDLIDKGALEAIGTGPSRRIRLGNPDPSLTSP